VGGVTRSKTGEDLAAIYERMRRRMLGLFGPQAWLDDVLQTAIEMFLRKKHTCREEGSLGAFAEVIALNTARDWMRRQRRGVLVRELFAERGPWPAPSPGPVEEMEDRDRIRRLTVILERLKPDNRIAYLLYHVENRSVSEIAEISGATEAAVRKRISRARDEIHLRARRDPVLTEWLENVRKA